MKAVPPQALAGLQPDLLPAAPGLWPLAPGWWVLGFVLLVVGIWTGPRALRFVRRCWVRWYWERQLRSAARRSASHPSILAREVAAILRAVAVARYGRERAAGLTGVAWLAFLEETSRGQAPFVRDGSALLWLPYVPDSAEVEGQASQQLVKLATRWVRSC